MVLTVSRSLREESKDFRCWNDDAETAGIMDALHHRRRESPYLSRRVKLTAVHFLFVLPVWLNIISSDETTWTPFVWETMDRNNTQSLLGARTRIQTTISTPRYIILSFHRRKNLGTGERLGWILATNIFSLAHLSLNFAEIVPIPPLSERRI